MKVLQINAVYGSLSTGTITQQIQECSKSHGIESFIAFPKGVGQPNIWSFEIGTVLDRRIHAVLARIAGKQAYYSSSATKKLLRYMDRLKPNIVHLHNLHSNYINLNMLLMYLAKHDIITIITMHDCWYFTGGCFHYTNAGCNKWQYGCGNCPKKMLDTPAYFYDASSIILRDRAKYLNEIPRLVMVGCSDWVSNECRKSVLKCKNIRTIHNGFDLSIFKTSPSDWRARLGIEDKFVILAPASKWLSAENKETYDYFVSKMAKDMVLVLFGCKTMDPNPPSNVRQIGFIHNSKEMAEVYSMADVMVNCSREDTLSSLNLESQACGTPVVTYEATGSKETVDGVCGFAVETGNEKLLLGEVYKLYSISPEERNHINTSCRQRTLREFEKSVSYEKYIKLYEEMFEK